MLEKRAEIILLAPTSLYASMSTLRIYAVMFNFKRIKRSFDEITEFELKSEMESEFIRKLISRFARTSVAYVIFMFSALGSALVAPIFEKERVLPVPIWFPLDWQNNLFYYWLAYIFSTLGQLALVVLNSFIPIFIWFLMYGNALKLKLLGDRIATLGYQSTTERGTVGNGIQYQRAAIVAIHKYIKVHKEISQYQQAPFAFAV
ncbi:putative odorant receptor 71a [Pseudolycoriella hygida]|uniref:Odorant receptor 71a n=1 Tax=Pseudolycoriella hygida TaxID=35572 RepID=A0A9Q0S2P2_9DIPT|nr:putative odorant receptor 71a [Pseudolycoriella hygida]